MLRACRIALFDMFPRVFAQLLDAKRHFAFFAVKCKDHSLYFVAHLHKILCAAQMLSPTHFRHVDQSFYPRSHFYKGTIVSHHHNFAAHLISHLQARIKCIPRMRSQLFQTERNTFLLIIKVKNYNIDLFIKLNNLFRMRNTSPRKVGNMDQPVHAAKVDKHTVRCDILDRTFEYLAFFELRDDFFLLLLELGLDQRLMRHDDVLEILVNLHDFEFHRLADKYVIVTDWLHIDLRAGQESLDTEDIDDHTALCTAFNVTFDDFVFFKRFVDPLPRTSRTRFLVRQNQLPFFIFLIFNINFHFIADLQIRVISELGHRYDTVRLETNVNHHLTFVQ